MILKNRRVLCRLEQAISTAKRRPTTTITTSTNTATPRTSASTSSPSMSIMATPFCMGSVMNVEASILARIAPSVRRSVLIGNPLPVIKHPLRMAEELAEIDLISRGRLVTGWVRGAGSEQFFNNANPPTTARCSTKRTTSSSRRGRDPVRGATKANIFIIATSIRGRCRIRNRIRRCGFPGRSVPRPSQWCAEHRLSRISGLVRRWGRPAICGTSTRTKRPSMAIRPGRRTSAI